MVGRGVLIGESALNLFVFRVITILHAALARENALGVVEVMILRTVIMPLFYNSVKQIAAENTPLQGRMACPARVLG